MPKFGILCNFVEGSQDPSDKLSINQDYITYFDSYGDTTLIDPLSDKIKNVDCLVLIGGSDINPALYGDYYDLTCSQANRALEQFDAVMLPQYLQNGIKAFGICRGFQRLAIGVPEITGSLHKHIPDEQSSQYLGAPAHFVGDFHGNSHFLVNSTHHQTVNVLAQNLVPLLWSYEAEQVGQNKVKPGDRRYIEAFVHKDNLSAGCQWHPERGWQDKPLRKAEEFVRNLIENLLH